ncbi:MAG: sigma-70 family RNA polymerase sigma factor [bacterium]
MFSKFITYAVWWIRQTILQAFFNHSRVVRLPQNHLPRVRHVIRTATQLERKLQRTPAIVEITEALGDEDDSFWSAQLYLQTSQSIDAPLGYDRTDRLLYLIPDHNEPPPDAALQSESFEKALTEAFRILDKREAKVLRLVFGLSNGRPLTLDEVGESYKLSKERIRQIRNQALGKLRRSRSVRETLRDYLG